MGHSRHAKYKKAVLFFRISISLLLLVWLFRLLEWNLFIQIIRGTNINLIFVGFLLVILGSYLSVLRWQPALQHFGFWVGNSNLTSLYLIGSFFNNFLPSSFGGDGYKYIALNNVFSGKKSKILATLVFDRGIGFAVLLFINVILIPFFLRFILQNSSLLILEGFILLSLLLLFLLFFFYKAIAQFANDIAGRWTIFRKLVAFIHLIPQFHKIAILCPAFFFAFLFVFKMAVEQLLYLHALGIKGVPVLLILLFVTIISIAGILPISLNTIGISEGLTVFLYQLIGISPETALALALITRGETLAASLVGGVIYHLTEARGGVGTCLRSGILAEDLLTIQN